MSINIEELKDIRIHFIGVGGIGMSAIARYCLNKGAIVSGSDISESNITKALQKEGVNFWVGENADNIPKETDLLVYTIAISKENPELVFAKENNIETKTYPQMLGSITSNEKTIAVAGTHGKTTTTAMTYEVLKSGNKSPNVIIGSLIKNPEKENEYTNYIKGDSHLFVIEACEYKRSFLNVNPEILIITNIEEDHLDYYKDLSDIQNAFRELAEKVPENGAVICDTKDSNLKPVIDGLQTNIIDYSQINIDDISLKVPGEHNRNDARCAFAVGDFIDIEKEDIKKGLEIFTGTWRRFEYKGMYNDAKIYDDYAHHPTEINATIQGIKEVYPENKIILAFHPHLYSRTKDLLDGFSDELAKVDEVLVAPIFPAREIFDGTISNNILAEEINKKGGNAKAMDFDEIENYIKENADKEKIFITMGAGDIYKVADRVVGK